MKAIDKTDYVSLTSYTRRFTSDDDAVIEAYLNTVGALNAVTLWERKIENESFKESAIASFISRIRCGGEITLDEFLSTTNTSAIERDEDSIWACPDVFNDYVAYLTENSVNT